MIRVVVERANDDASRAGHRGRRGIAARVREIMHFAGAAAAQPFRQSRQFRKIFRRRDAAEIESERAGAFDDERSLCRGPHSNRNHIKTSSVNKLCPRRELAPNLSERYRLERRAARMFGRERLASNPGAYPQSQDQQRTRGATRKTFRAHPRCHGCIRAGRRGRARRQLCGSNSLVHRGRAALPPRGLENESARRIDATRCGDSRNEFSRYGTGGPARNAGANVFLQLICV